MSSGERPIGAAKGEQPNAEALCQPPTPGLASRVKDLKGTGCDTPKQVTGQCSAEMLELSEKNAQNHPRQRQGSRPNGHKMARRNTQNGQQMLRLPSPH